MLLTMATRSAGTITRSGLPADYVTAVVTEFLRDPDDVVSITTHQED